MDLAIYKKYKKLAVSSRIRPLIICTAILYFILIESSMGFYQSQRNYMKLNCLVRQDGLRLPICCLSKLEIS